MSYRIRNWSEYNAALKQQGSLTFWMDEAVLEQWVIPNLSGKPGASNFYSDLAIRTMATVKAVYGLAGRQCQGFLESIFKLMEIELSVPDHSTLSRRLGQLAVKLPVLPKSGARHVVVDSTGVKVYGEGEWKTRQHGISKRRSWRKLHLGVDEATGEILAAVVTTNETKAHELSLSRLFVEASITAKPFFQRMGFVVVKQQEVTLRGEVFINYAMEKLL